MKKILLALLVTTLVWGQDTQDDTDLTVEHNATELLLETPQTVKEVESDLYVTYEELPSKLYKNQLFTISAKIVNANQELSKLVREVAAFDGIKVLQNYPDSKKDAYTTIDTYYFQAKERRIKTPDLYYMLNRTDQSVLPVKLDGKYFSTIELKSDDDFCQILAQDFKITSYKTTPYDQLTNIIVFSAEADAANIEDFNLTHAVRQGFYSHKYMLPMSRMTYYAVVPKHLRKLEFNYFNIQE